LVRRADEGNINILNLLGSLNPRLIVEEDLALIEDCDAIIAYINGDTSYGTIMEIVYAHLSKKLIAGVITNGYVNHPWLKHHCTDIYTNFNEMEDEFLR
jgi:nucleoside 2-deoxyribosyltransferase